jgi:CheY-like chemotaxis protein
MTRDPSSDASASGQLPLGVAELPRMLIVEDNDQLRRELVAHFTERGWSVEATRTFRAALAIARRHLPAVILTELLLPDVRGYRFAQEYRDAVGKPVMIVAVTRIPMMIFESARRAGFDEVLGKPVDLEALERFVEPAMFPITGSTRH